MSSSPASVERMNTTKSSSGGGFGGILTIILVVACIGLLIACLVQYSAKNDLQKTFDAQKAELDTVKKDLDGSRSQLANKTREADALRADLGKSIRVASLPAPLQGATPGEAMDKIQQLLSGGRPAMPVPAGGTPGPSGPGVTPAPVAADSPAAWMENIARQVATKSFNTKEPVGTDAAKQQMHRGTQIVLTRIGAFSKPVSGNPQDTYDAVLAFQKANGLKADGIIGKGTWGKVREKFDALPR